MVEQNFSLPEYIQVLDETQQEVRKELEKLDRKSRLIEISRLYIKSSQAEMLDLYNKNNKLLEDMGKLQEGQGTYYVAFNTNLTFFPMLSLG